MQNRYIQTLLLLLLVANIAPSFAKTKTSEDSVVSNKQVLDAEQQRKFDSFFYEAANAKALGKYDALADYLDYCLQIDSTNSAALYEYGNLWNSLEKKSKALELYKKAVKYDTTKNFYYSVALAALYLDVQQYTEAINVYESLVAREPDKAELYLYLSESYRLDGNLPKAIEALDNVEKSAGLNEKISLQKFQLYSALDQKEKAYGEFQKYLVKYPQNIKYYVFLGNLYLEDNKKEEAYIVLQKAKAIDPNDPYLIVAMSNYYDKMGMKDDSQRELYSALYSQKLDIDVKLEILSQHIGSLQQKTGNTLEANALVDTLMTMHPQEPKLNLLYGNLLMLQKNKKEAQFQYRIFTESNPSNPAGWEQLLKTVEADSLDQSKEICKMAISYLPEEPLFYYYLGITEFQKEEKQEALKTFEKGVSLLSEEDSPILASEFYGLIGSLHFDLNNRDSAFVAYEKAIQYNPRNLGVLNNYGYYLSIEKKDLQRAEKMSEVTIKAEPTNPTFLDTYGWIIFMQGDYVTAKIYIENAVKYSIEKEEKVSADVFEHFGDVLFKTGDQDKALEYWLKAKEAGGSKSKTLEEKIRTKTYIAE